MVTMTLKDLLSGSEDDESDDDDGIDEDLHQMVLEAANKTDNSGFRNSIKYGTKIEVLTGARVQWTTSAAPSYHVRVSTEGSSF